MTNVEFIEEYFATDKAIRTWRAHIKKHDPDYLPEFDRTLEEGKNRQMQFWQDRENERIDRKVK